MLILIVLKIMKLGIIIVCYDDKVDSTKLIEQLIIQKNKNDKILIIDNNPQKLNSKKLQKIKGIYKIINQKNIGFGAACNLGAEQLKDYVDYFLFLNPDTKMGTSTLDEFRKIDAKHDAYMGLLLTNNNTINNNGTLVHITGMSWCGDLGKKKSKNNKDILDINYASGACLLIKKEVFFDVAGFDASYFLYYEDTDLCSKIIKRGGKIALLNKAIVYHDYTESVSDIKYFNLQKNRIIYMIENWPLLILIVLSPIILISEFTLLLHSLITFRFGIKLKSYFQILRNLDNILNSRKFHNKLTKINDLEYFRTLSYEIDSKLMPRNLLIDLVNYFFKIYFRLALNILNLIY